MILRKNKIHKKIFMGLGIILIGFLTWFLINLFTINTNLQLNVDFELPEFNNFEDLVETDYGSYAVAIDGKIVGGQNIEKISPTASTAKMILSLAIMKEKPFELGEPGEDLEINQEFYDKYIWYYRNGGSVSAVQNGETISEYDALASTLLASSNNMADTLAIWAFGSMDNYREYAINMLAEWGIDTVSIGVDASGFDESTTATASDLAIIGTKLLENPVLAEIVNLKSYTVPVEGEIKNTNGLLGQNRISGIKTGYIGDVSGYCLVSGYFENDDHIVTLALMGAPTRSTSFYDSLTIINQVQEKLTPRKIISAGDKIGHYESWWAGEINIIADEDLEITSWNDAEKSIDLDMDGVSGELIIKINEHEYRIKVSAINYNEKPSFIEKIIHIFGWKNDAKNPIEEKVPDGELKEEENKETEELKEEPTVSSLTTETSSGNCTIKYGNLMLINPNFMVETNFIAERRNELVSISSLYGIKEGNPYNGDNLLDPEAAEHINDMVRAYETDYPGHTLETRSCFRSVGTKCGRLCAATGASDHHTGLTCDLVDPVYGDSLDTDTYNRHTDWQWLKANSYKYGFIDRFPEAWAGGSMAEPLNVDENGSTGLFETWHYRYVGIEAATEIATGKYNNGEYDSLEHYLKSIGLINDLKNGVCK